MKREHERIRIAFIDVPRRKREVSAEGVATLAASMKKIGLLSPISVRYFPDRPSADGTRDDSSILVAGATRLAAAKVLGWTEIDCVVVDCDDIEAELQEISENLHRTELTALERSEQEARWIELTEAKRNSAQVAPNESKRPDGRGHRPESGINAAARELGVERTEIQRALKVASLTPEAKTAARAVGLDDNRSALLKAAKAEPEKQVAVIKEIAAAKAASPSEEGAAERKLQLLMTAWNGSPESVRLQFLDRIAVAPCPSPEPAAAPPSPKETLPTRMEVVHLPISKLRRRAGARKIVEEVIPGIMASIREVGVMHPLRVRPMQIVDGGVISDGWEITIGGHRFEAASRLKLETVPCVVVEEDDLHADRAALDENSERTDSSPEDRALWSDRRKAVTGLLRERTLPKAPRSYATE